MHKAYRFRIYTNKEQAELMNKSIGCSRFVYNYFLAKWNEIVHKAYPRKPSVHRGLTSRKHGEELLIGKITDASWSEFVSMMEYKA